VSYKTSPNDLTISRYLNTNFDIVKYVADFVPQIVITANYVDQLDQLLEPLYYLGPKPTDPTTDNAGNTLLVGSMYYNTVENELRTWNGTSWDNPQSYANTLLKANNLSDLTNVATARTNLGLGSAALQDSSYFATATDLTTVSSTAGSAVQPNTDVSLANLTATTLTTGNVQLTGGSGTQGTLSWNADEETLDLIQNGAVLQVGQEVHYHVRNNSGIGIPDGSAVMATGTLGASGRITAALMDGSNPSNAKFFLGIATEAIADGDDGKVSFFGKVRGINTTAFLEGDVLWVDQVTPGLLTKTEPTTGLKLPVGITISSKANGTIFVRATNGHALHESHDVAISGIQDGDVLAWDNANSRWVNSSTGSGITNISTTQIDNVVTIQSSTGLDDSILTATASYAGTMSKEDKQKLDNIPETLTYTLSDGTNQIGVTIQNAIETEQTKIIFGGSY